MKKIIKGNTQDKKLSLLVIANVPGPNLNDFYDEIAKNNKIDLMVLFCSKKTKKWREGIPASENYNHKFLFNLNIFSKYARFQLNPGVLRYLLFSRPDVIQIQGYNTPTLLGSLLILNTFQRPFVYWGEMINRSASKNPVSLSLKKLVVKILNKSKRVYVVGSTGVESYTKLGINSTLLHKLPYSCDLSPFFKISRSRKTQKRNHYSIVTTSQLIYRKRVDLLIEAFSLLADEFPKWTLNIIGDGILRQELSELVPEQHKNKVTWHGYLEKKKHPDIYAKSDIFVLSSREDGGPMVLPEAMASGLPIITTTGVATASDVVEEGKNGFIIEKDQLALLSSSLRQLMDNEKLRLSMGEKSAQRALGWDAYHIANEYIEDLIRHV